MKRTLLIGFFIVVAAGVQAQTFNEWFKQKKTQLKYLVQQIAALEAYAIVLEKGYNIVESGLHTIGDIKNGEFHLHTDFFDELKTVNPTVSKYPQIQAILQHCADIAGVISKDKKDIASMPLLTAGETAYIKKVYDGITDECNRDLADLSNIISDNSLTLSDDERLHRIDVINSTTSDKLSFVRSFSGQLRLLVAARKKDSQDISTINAIYGIQK